MNCKANSLLLFFLSLTLINYYIYSTNYFVKQNTHSLTYKPINITQSVPALWIFGPAKAATTSLIQGMTNSFTNWITPFDSLNTNIGYKGNEKNYIWEDFETNCYQSNIEQFNQLMIYNISIIVNNYLKSNKDKNISLNDYPFDEILSNLNNIKPLEPIVKNNILNLQNKEFEYGINRSKTDKTLSTVQKSVRFIYSPLTPIIFAYWISPINYISKTYGTKILIMLRDSTKRIISWYSMFFTKRFIRKYDSKNKINDLITYQLLTISMNYEPLNYIREMIINRTNEIDDILILTQYFKFYYGFKKLFHECFDNKWQQNECKSIDICLYKCISNKHKISDREKIMFQSPIHMLFTGLFYPHLLLNLSLFKQKKLLSTRLRFMSFDYLINNPKNALYLLKCWSENIDNSAVCNDDNIAKFKFNHKDIWVEISLTKQMSQTLNISSNIVHGLNEYFNPITIQIQQLLDRYNKNDNIFIGESNVF